MHFNVLKKPFVAPTKRLGHLMKVSLQETHTFDLSSFESRNDFK